MTKRAYVDSSVWIERIEGMEKYHNIIDEVWQDMIQEGWQFCISEPVILEVMCRPLWNNDQPAIEAYNHAFSQAYMLPYFEGIFQSALSIIRLEQIKSLDAIHLAYASHYQCDRFITTDTHFKSVTTVPIHFIDLASAFLN